MTLKDLQDGQTVKYRLGRAGHAAPRWEEWKTGTLYLVRRQMEWKRGHQAYPAGEILDLTIRDDGGCASYNERDFYSIDGESGFIAEDYYLEIEGLHG